MKTHHQLYAGPPEFGDQYLTVKEFARVMNCSERHVRRIANNLILSEFGVPIISVPFGTRGRRTIYIFSPSSMLP